MKLSVPLILGVLVAVLGQSSDARAVAQSVSQDASRPAQGASPSTPSRPQLFQVRFVLIKAPPRSQDDLPLDFGNEVPAIRWISGSGSHGVLLKGNGENPNTYTCYGWSCMDSLHR